MEEVWRDVSGYEGYYQISSTGKVKSLDRYIKRLHHYKFLKGRILKSSIGARGYPQVQLSKDNIQKNYCIHKLVADAFIPNFENKPHVNHIDGDKTNSVLWNLEWNTVSENTQHAFDNGLVTILRGESRHNAKLKEEDVLTIRDMFTEGCSAKEIANKFNISRDYANEIRRRKVWKHI